MSAVLTFEVMILQSDQQKRTRSMTSWLVVVCLCLQSLTPWAYAHPGMADASGGMACQDHHQDYPHDHHQDPLVHAVQDEASGAVATMDDHQACERACAISPMAAPMVVWSVEKMPLSVRVLLKAPHLPSYSSELFKPPPIA